MPEQNLKEMTPPQNLEAERCLLGSMMLDNAVIGEVLQLVEPEHFYQNRHQLVFKLMIESYDQGRPVEVGLLQSELERLGKLEEVGGFEYLLELVESVHSAASAIYYGELVRDRFLERRLIDVCRLLIRETFEKKVSPEKLLDLAEQRIFNIVQHRTRTQSIQIVDILRDVFRRIEQIRDRKGRLLGVPTGFHELDDLLCGFQPSQLIIVAGRPSMGKSSFAMRVMEHVGFKEGLPVVLYSMEMDSRTIAQNMLCSHCHVNTQSLRSGRITDKAMQEMLLVAGEFAKAPILIDDSSELSIMDLRARARRAKSEFNVGLVIIDYLQLMESRGEDSRRPAESRQAEVAKISRSLKALARELEVPVIALSQLSRAPEGREDHQPRLSDLRESGTIEQDADVVMMLYREEYYKKDTDKKGICEINVAKQRNGPTGAVKLLFQPEFMRFENLDPLKRVAPPPGVEAATPSAAPASAGGPQDVPF